MVKVNEKTFQELVDEIRSSQRGSVEVPEDFADNFLGAVPPAVQNANGFICGEPYSGDKHYTFFYKRDQSGSIESYQAELLPIGTAKAILEGKIIDKDGFNFIQLDQHKGWNILIADEERKYSKASLWLQDPHSKDIRLAQELTTYNKRSEVYKIIEANLEIKKSENKESVASGLYVDGEQNRPYIATLAKVIGSANLKQEGLLNEYQSLELQKEIESKYNKPGEHKFGQDNEDIRQHLYSYEHPLAEKEINGVNLRIAEGLIEGEKYSGKRRRTYLLYADGKIAGKFYSIDDTKKVVKFIEDNLVEALPQKTESQSLKGLPHAETQRGVSVLGEVEINGNEVWHIAKKAGSEHNDALEIYEKQIRETNYKLIDVPIEVVIKNDADLKSLIEKDVDFSSGEFSKKRKITQPIIIGQVNRGGDNFEMGVVDGGNRMCQAIANGDKTIKAFVPVNSVDKIQSQSSVVKNEPTGEAVKEEVRQPVQSVKVEPAKPAVEQPVKPSESETVSQEVGSGVESTVELNKEEKEAIKKEGGKEEDFDSVRKYFKKPFQEEGLPNIAEGKGAEFMEDDYNSTEETVQLKDLIPTQRVVDIKAIESKKNTDETPIIIRNGNDLFVLDGHHRISQAVKNGETKIKADIFDVTELNLPTYEQSSKKEQYVPKDGWKNNLIKAREYAQALGIDFKGKELDEIVPDGKETEVNPEARGNEQTGTGIKQEDAENITRDVQSASPNTQESQRSTRQVKQEQDEALQNEIKELPTKKVSNKVQAEVKKGEKKVASDTEIKGDDVWESSKKAGSENNNELSRHEEQIRSTRYAKIKIPIDKLLYIDQDLMDFVAQSKIAGAENRAITQPIIIGDVSRGYPLKNDCVLDGFNRVVQAIINGDKQIDAYVPTNSKYLENARSEKMGQDQKVIVGVNDNAHTDVNDERIYNSKWRGYR